MKFASPEWCEAYKNAVNEDQEVARGWADPNEINFNVEFGVTDGSKFHYTLEKGKITYCGEPKFSENELDFIATADAGTWQQIAARTSPLSIQLTMGKVKLVKGPLATAIKNVKALDRLGYNFGSVETEWS